MGPFSDSPSWALGMVPFSENPLLGLRDGSHHESGSGLATNPTEQAEDTRLLKQSSIHTFPLKKDRMPPQTALNGQTWSRGGQTTPLMSSLQEVALSRDFPSGPVVKNVPVNAGDTGLIPGPGRSHIPRGN